MTELRLVRSNEFSPGEAGPGGEHECCICGKRGEWNKNWTWYGNLLDGCGNDVDKCCSKKCRDEYNKKYRVPYANREIIKTEGGE